MGALTDHSSVLFDVNIATTTGNGSESGNKGSKMEKTVMMGEIKQGSFRIDLVELFCFVEGD